ncbi:hypothetical protein K2Z83_15705 [Oscillochloris sp. ZM17-4]|uniref:hypothetical protein n=1 Tax=Oscillochloris sp. ZM17-4 TaxID=2866714 RepID=UPI001C73A882|nr:hypothetical protein [Oscillochloris sp. ZM17-4]MBX0329123.1 hypothetical protein [Oscillochloris sp. ZM17-4]
MRYVHPALAFDGMDATFQSSSQGDAEYHHVGLDNDGQEPIVQAEATLGAFTACAFAWSWPNWRFATR